MTNPYKPRARNLSDTDIDTIVRMLDGWVGELTWYTLIDAIKVCQKTNIGYARQALHHHKRIHSAYLRNKKRLREAEKAKKIELKQQLRMHMQAKASALLEADSLRLKVMNELFLKQFITQVSGTNPKQPFDSVWRKREAV